MTARVLLVQPVDIKGLFSLLTVTDCTVMITDTFKLSHMKGLCPGPRKHGSAVIERVLLGHLEGIKDLLS